MGFIHRHEYRFIARCYAGGHFHRTAIGCPIADDSADVTNHAANPHAHGFEFSRKQIGDTRTAPHRGSGYRAKG